MNIYDRIFFDITLFLFVITSPWWLAVALALYLFFKLENYLEFILAGLLFDVLYGIRIEGHIIISQSYGFLLSFVIFIILYIFKKHLRLYA